jgi:hypothetical protein
MKYIWSTYVYGIVQIRLPSFSTHLESILWISSIGKVFRPYLKILEVNKKIDENWRQKIYLKCGLCSALGVTGWMFTPSVQVYP